MSKRVRRATPRRTARHGLPVQGAVPPRRPVTPVSRRKGPFIALALVVVALTAGLAVRRVAETGYFQVRTVRVSGAAMLPEYAVIDAAGVQGKQLWQVDTGEVAATVRALPGIKDVHVQRAWPNLVTVRVEEREPAAVWRSGGAEYVVDEEGVVLQRPVMGGLPAITQMDGGALNEGDRVSGDAVRLASQLVAILPSAIGQRVTRFEYSSGNGLDIVTDRGLRVHFGDGQNVDYKLELWRGIADQARQDKLSPGEIDLRFGQWAAVR